MDADIDFDALLALPIIFMVIIVPLWLSLHYWYKSRASKALSKADEETLAELWQLSEKLERRVESLETILDREAPGWRHKS
ncbi:envelope stress response membrane protein PspB [Thiolapillus brandeum]|uniref:Phage shock protein B n=1 Tax=Thiolapillus brandeum TaxID=1076588 RepID=A0A7U6GHU8_9GAMM|nr:envelope stress response membrane protein PspB [Thiolapillus brandeum]BAO43939.1 phage shock protein B [Thiolapillus brandeum]